MKHQQQLTQHRILLFRFTLKRNNQSVRKDLAMAKFLHLSEEGFSMGDHMMSNGLIHHFCMVTINDNKRQTIWVHSFEGTHVENKKLVCMLG